MTLIYSGKSTDACRESGDWVFVDLGFANQKPSCGIAINDENPEAVTFAELQKRLLDIVKQPGRTLNLVLEAPLSVAFSESGNPARRSIEKRDGERRYWYCGPGSSVLVAATYLIRALHDGDRAREIRLFEGFVTFKQNNTVSSHTADVAALREIVWQQVGHSGQIIDPKELRLEKDQLQSAFAVAGLDLGVPPVIAVGI